MKRILIALLFASSALAQNAPPADHASTVRDKLAKLGKGEAAPPAATPPSSDPMAPGAADASALSDPPTRAMYLSSWREYFAYRADGLRHRRRVFEWQLLSSKIIFVIVLLLVFSGIYFAAVQFHTGLKREVADQPTQLEASMQGIKITSPVLGVIILVLSLAFFYCYLVYVYPIENIF